MDFPGFKNFFKCVFQAVILTRLSACLFIYLFEDLPSLSSVFAWLSLPRGTSCGFFSRSDFDNGSYNV